MISKEEAQKTLLELIADADPANPKSVTDQIVKFLQYLADHEHDLAPEVVEMWDNFVDYLVDAAGSTIESLPDSAMKREAARLHAKAKGQHLDAGHLIRSLDQPREGITLLGDFAPVSQELIQANLDIQYEARTEALTGPAEIAKLTLGYWAADELLAAHHLIVRTMANAAYSHIRSAYEMRDKILLFHQQPELAKIWIGDDWKAQLRELSPAAVREKLGNERFDRIYSFFSEMGPHGTFEGLRARSGFATESEDAEPRLKVWIGGAPFEHVLVGVTAFYTYVSIQILLASLEVWENRLNVADAAQTAIRCIKQVHEFNQKHFVGWVKREKLDAETLEHSMEAIFAQVLRDLEPFAAENTTNET